MGVVEKYQPQAILGAVVSTYIYGLATPLDLSPQSIGAQSSRTIEQIGLINFTHILKNQQLKFYK